MLQLLATVALLDLLAAMTPGPDFAIVTRNTIAFSRKTGLYTALGIATAITIHVSYCSLGLAIIIASSPLIFGAIKLLGGTYLIYLGISSLRSNAPDKLIPNSNLSLPPISNFKAFKQGFITNLTNPKCMLFFLALFTMVVQDATFQLIDLAMIVVFFITNMAWFGTLTILLSHKKIEPLLKRWQGIIIKITGVFLIGFGLALYFVHVAHH